MQRIKKVVAVLLCFVMVLYIIPALSFANMRICAVDNNEATKYILPIQKNGIEAIEIEVYVCDGKYYTIPQNIANLTRTKYIDAGQCPVYGGKSFVFQQGIFEVSVDVENQKMYSCLTEYEYSIRDTLESKIDFVNRYLDLDNPIQNYAEFDEIITDDMIEQVDAPDEIKEIFINEPELSLETYALDHTDVSIVNIDSQYMIELIPWLRYMGAECGTSDSCLKVDMPYRTLWESIMPDLHRNTHNKVQAEKSEAHNAWDVTCSVFVDVISDLPGFFKNMFVDVAKDVTGQQSGDKYVEEAIYDILQVDYSNSQQINEKVEAINEYVGLTNSDVIDAADSIFEHAYDDYNSYLPYLTNNIPHDKYEKLCDEAVKIKNLQNNTEALKFVLGCAVTIDEKLNYSDDTKQSLNSVLNLNIDNYVKDDSDGKWTDTARRIMNDIGSTENIVSGTILDKGIDLLLDKGKETGLALFGKQNYATLGFDLAKSMLIDAPMFRPVWEGYDAQLYMIKQNEIQVDMLELIDSLAEKSIITERCSDSDSLTELADALKFYYRAVIAHADNSVKYLEEVDMFNKNGDTLIKEYRALSEKTTEYLYNISNCAVTPFRSYTTLKNDLITEEWMEQFLFNDVDNIVESAYLKIEELKNEWGSYGEIWFQDLDFDDIYELIVDMGVYSEGYYFNGDEYVKITQENVSENCASMSGLRLYYNTDTESYGYYKKWGITRWHSVCDVVYENGILTLNTVVSGNEADEGDAETYNMWFGTDGKEISQQEYNEIYNEYVDSFIEYAYKIDPINNYEDSYAYASLNSVDKKERLKKSYESFAIGDEIGAFRLLEKDFTNDIIINEGVWRPYGGGYYSTQTMWFQDLDLDGDNEFIVGGYQGGTNHLLHGYYAYDYTSDGNIVEYDWLRSTGEEVLTLCLDSNTNTWKYVKEFNDFYSVYGCTISLEEYGKGDIVSRFESNEEATEIPDDFKLSWFDGQGNEITESQYAEIYNSILKNLIKYSYTTDVINLSDYDGMTQDEKYERLKKSYDGFEIGGEIGGFERYVTQNSESGNGQVVSDESDWKTAYLDYLENEANYKHKSGQFALINLNNDGIPDIFCRYEVSGLAGGGQSIWAYVDGEVKSASLIKSIGTDGTAYLWNGETVNNPYTEWDNATHYSYEEIKSQIENS